MMEDKDFLFKETMKLYCACISAAPLSSMLLTDSSNYEQDRLFEKCMNDVQRFYEAMNRN